jgi:hypothetical protein
LIPVQWRKVTEKFIAACRLAADRAEQMEFMWDPAATVRRLIHEHLREKFAAAGAGRVEVRIPAMAHGSTVR